MAAPMRRLTPPSDFHINKDGSPKWRLRVKVLLVICSHRIWRGGPRSLLQIGVLAFFIIILFYIVPLQLGDGHDKWMHWSTPLPVISHDIRIVVFGSQDLLGSAPDAGQARLTWPELLCEELNCSSLLSFVPPVESQPGLVSNIIYSKELDDLSKLSREANITAQPASDYFFVPEQYPAPRNTPDLEAQVRQFLSMPPPKSPPHETLWVFTFGTWEVWNLAALPRESGERLITASVTQLFSTIELLYKKSLNPSSVAFSDFWSNMTSEEAKALTEQGTDGKVDGRRLESFRVVLPQLLDISLAPGWQSRPLPSIPQSRGIQLRNAAYLTAKWNSEISLQLHNWMMLGTSKPVGIDEEGVNASFDLPSVDALLKYLPESIRPGQKQPSNDSAEGVIYAPYPRRAGLQTYVAVNVLDAMTEEEMRRSGLKDSRGRGTVPDDGAMRFFDVWTPCSVGSRPIVGVEAPRISNTCDAPNDHLFYDHFTLGERVAEELAKKAADGIREQLFPTS